MTKDYASTTAIALYVLRVEGQNYDWVIFDTHDLSTIAGGSRLLEMAPRHVESILPNLAGVKAVETIQCVASTGLFALAAEKDKIGAIVNGVKERLAQGIYKHLTVSVEAVEVSNTQVNIVDDCKFANSAQVLRSIAPSVLNRLQVAARFGQMRALNVAVPAMIPSAVRACVADHTRPAIGNHERAQSKSVQDRRSLGKEFRWKGVSAEDVKLVADSAEPPISERDTTETVQSFDEMTKYARKEQWSGKLALISIDGKGFGKLSSSLVKNAADLKWFSQELTRNQSEFWDSVRGAWAADKKDAHYFLDFIPDDDEKARGRQEGQLFRLQRLMTAGDDAVYLMPAWLAWEFLEMFFKHPWQLREIDALSKADDVAMLHSPPKPLEFRVGVVICSAKAPIHPIHSLARELEGLGRRDGNPIAYEVLKSFDIVGQSLEGYRKKRRGPLNESEIVLDGNALVDTKARLIQLGQDHTSAEIKNPARWPKGKESDAYHLSQWRDYFED
jgi:hypothetical protein